jgi:two-component system LytT family sensor kinase
MLMVSTSVQEYLRDRRPGVWKPILWETSSADRDFADAVAARARASMTHLLSSRQLVRAPAGMAAGVLDGIRAGRLQHPHMVYAMAGDTYTHEAWLQTFLYEDVKITIFFFIFATITFGVLSYHAMLNEKLRVERANASLRKRNCCGSRSRCSRTSCSMR